jgi:hypothetical protein
LLTNLLVAGDEVAGSSPITPHPSDKRLSDNCRTDSLMLIHGADRLVAGRPALKASGRDMTTDPEKPQHGKQTSGDKNLVRPQRLDGFLSAY